MAKFLLVMAAIGGSLLALSACGSADISRFMERYLWEKRVLLIFTPSLEDGSYLEQKALLEQAAAQGALAERDMVTITLARRDRVMIDGEAVPRLFAKPFYEFYDVGRDSFTVILIGKDGTEKLRSYPPVETDTLFKLIDSMPMRQQEMQGGDKSE